MPWYLTEQPSAEILKSYRIVIEATWFSTPSYLEIKELNQWILKDKRVKSLESPSVLRTLYNPRHCMHKWIRSLTIMRGVVWTDDRAIWHGHSLRLDVKHGRFEAYWDCPRGAYLHHWCHCVARPLLKWIRGTGGRLCGAAVCLCCPLQQSLKH